MRDFPSSISTGPGVFFQHGPFGFDSRIPRRYIGFVNASIKVNDQVILNPMGYYNYYGSSSEAVLGMNAQYNLSGDGDQQVIGGLYYRAGDAVIPMIGYLQEYKANLSHMMSPLLP